MNRLFSLLLLLVFQNTEAQKFDNIWPGGLNEYPGAPGSGNYLVRFDNGVPVVEQADLKMNFESTVAAIADSTGKLLFYTNGCWLARADGSALGEWFSTDTVPLNPGPLRETVCPNTGYIVPKGAMLLPSSISPNTYILLHMGAKYDEKWVLSYGPFYFTIFNGISGSYQAQNEVLLPLVLAPVAQVKRYEPFSVVRHGSGKGWWVIVPEYGKNIYHVFTTGVFSTFPKLSSVQTIGPNLKCKRIGSTVFSPDGSKFARVQNCGVVTMDFDRCSGLFSNPVKIDLPGHTFGGSGAAFSGDNAQLVLTSQVAVSMIDLTATPPTVDTIINSDTLVGNSLHHLQVGPDGKYYISSLQKTQNLSVVGDAFSGSPQYGHLDLPSNSVRSLPYFPNYNLYDWPNSPCDTLGINGPVAVTEAEPNLFEIWPNPASDHLFVQTNYPDGYVQIRDVFGRTVIDVNVGTSPVKIEMGGLPTGIYSATLLSKNGARLMGKKFILQ